VEGVWSLLFDVCVRLVDGLSWSLGVI
jgi:hypothetical protein